MDNIWIGLYEYDVRYYFMYYSCCIIHNNACIVHYLFRTSQNVQCCILSWYSSCWKFKLPYSAWNSKCQSKRSMAPARTRSSWARGPCAFAMKHCSRPNSNSNYRLFSLWLWLPMYNQTMIRNSDRNLEKFDESTCPLNFHEEIVSAILWFAIILSRKWRCARYKLAGPCQPPSQTAIVPL